MQLTKTLPRVTKLTLPKCQPKPKQTYSTNIVKKFELVRKGYKCKSS